MGMSLHRAYSGEHRSITVDFDHSLGKGSRGSLGQIVPGVSLDDLVGIFTRGFPAIGRAVGGRCDTVGFTIQGDRRYSNDRARGEPILEFVIFGVAFSEAKPPAVVVDHDSDVVQVVERRCGAIERGIIEGPLGRIVLPDQLAEIVPVLVVASAAPSVEK